MRVLERGAGLGAAVAAILVGSFTMAAPANAASTPVSVCGGGSYHEIDRRDLGGYATLYLLYNGKTNCVVTWKKIDIGINTYTSAFVGLWGQNGQNDEGMFGYYAGPVKVDAAGKCISWAGLATHNGRSEAWSPNSPSHCG